MFVTIPTLRHTVLHTIRSHATNTTAKFTTLPLVQSTKSLLPPTTHLTSPHRMVDTNANITMQSTPTTLSTIDFAKSTTDISSHPSGCQCAHHRSASTSTTGASAHTTHPTKQPDQATVAQNRATLMQQSAPHRRTAVDDMVAANGQFSSDYSSAFRQKLPMKPGKKLSVVMCMDSRIDAFRCFGLQHGDAHVIRNAGGRITEALRSVIISQALLGTEEIAIIHHTECGILRFNDEQIKEAVVDLKKQQPDASPDEVETARAAVDKMKFLTFAGSPFESVVEDLRIYRASPLVKHSTPVRGFVYDVHSGLLTEVEDQGNNFDYNKHYEQN